MNILPKSLAGQLIGLLLLGLLATHLTAQHLSGKQLGSMHGISRDLMLERYATAHRVLATCQATCDRPAILKALESSDARFFIIDEADRPSPMSSEEAGLAAVVASRLGTTATTAIHLHLQRATNSDLPARTLRVNISAALPGGQRLVGTLWPVVRNAWWSALGHGLLESSGVILVLVILFAGHLRRPLRALSVAHEAISRGERIAPLRGNGPRELRDAASAFNVMQERLGRFITDRTRMMAAISHDIRTPLTSLRLRVEMVNDHALRGAMARTLEEMRQMVDETLVFARDDSLHEASATIDLADLLTSVVNEQRALGRDVRWLAPPPLPYRCRPLALTRALNNLMDNAARYANRAHLSLATAADGIRISLADDGPGIPDDSLERVFEPFAQAGTAPRHDQREVGKGLGLGLAIARTCIKAHGGRIELSNRSAGGLQATILLPA